MKKYPSNDIQSFQESLKYERRRRGLSQTGLANLIGVSQSHLSYVESCKRDLTPERCAQIKKIFDERDVWENDL